MGNDALSSIPRLSRPWAGSFKELRNGGPPGSRSEGSGEQGGGSPEIVDGGGKDGRGPLGCGLEKRPPCPRGTGQKGMPRSSERGDSL